MKLPPLHSMLPKSDQMPITSDTAEKTVVPFPVSAGENLPIPRIEAGQLTLSEQLAWFEFSNLSELFEWFKTELMRPSRQNKSREKATDCVRLVRGVLETSQSITDVDKIYSGLEGLKRVDGKLCQPGTKYAALLGLKRLYTYLKQDRARVVQVVQLLDQLIERFSEWQPKFSALKSRRRSEVFKLDGLNLSKLDFSLAWNREYHEKYLEILSSDDASLANKIEARNFALLRIICENASRTGAICNITTDDILNCPRPDPSSNESVEITVSDHKTGNKGCAFISCSTQLFELLESLVKLSLTWSTKARSSDQESPTKCHLFLSSLGKRMSCSNVVSCVNTIYSKLGGQGRMSCTASRKRCARIAVRQKSATLHRKFAQAMNHSLNVHERFYSGRPDQGHDAQTQVYTSEMHQFLARHKHERVETITQPATDPSVNDSSDFSQRIINLPSQDDDTTAASDEIHDGTSVRHRLEYSGHDLLVLRSLLTEYFQGQTQRPISVFHIRQAMAERSDLAELMQRRSASARQIYDKLRKM